MRLRQDQADISAAMIMRSCCCCKVTTGSVIFGLLTLVTTALVMVPLVGYLTDTDIEVLSGIRDNQKLMEKVLEGRKAKQILAPALTLNFPRLPEDALVDAGRRVGHHGAGPHLVPHRGARVRGLRRPHRALQLPSHHRRQL